MEMPPFGTSLGSTFLKVSMGLITLMQWPASAQVDEISGSGPQLKETRVDERFSQKARVFFRAAADKPVRSEAIVEQFEQWRQANRTSKLSNLAVAVPDSILIARGSSTYPLNASDNMKTIIDFRRDIAMHLLSIRKRHHDSLTIVIATEDFLKANASGFKEVGDLERKEVEQQLKR